jgi:membrane-bound lytic murein transglycosylase A
VTPLTRFAVIVLVSLLTGAGLGAAFVRHMQPPPAPAPVVVAPVVPKTEIVARYTAIDVNELPGWSEDSVAQALPALRRSCEKFARMAPDAVIGRDTLIRSAQHWQTACRSLEQITDGDAALRAAVTRDFIAYRVSGPEKDPERGTGMPNDRGIFTAYYEADLNGSLTRGGNYQVPIYGVPRNLVTIDLKDFMPANQLASNMPSTLVGRIVAPSSSNDARGAGTIKPYFTRAEIDANGALAEDADVLLWADDPVAVHILHIQGSGRVTLPDGQLVRIGFAGHNGRAFRGIGSILLEAGEVKPGGASMVAVRAWLARHPTEALDYMNRNNRYIFFRQLEPGEAQDGPLGALGVSLTPGRSLAVDPRFIPLGAPIWLDTADPDGVPLKRLMVAQDVGAAITGPVRGDIFWGHGEEAFQKAGRMKSAGSYFVLVPKIPEVSPQAPAQPDIPPPTNTAK